MILFGDSGVEFKNIGLDGVGDVVDLFWIGTKATSEGFPEKGGRGKSSDNTLIQKLMGWELGTKLKDGLSKTYDWIKGEMG